MSCSDYPTASESKILKKDSGTLNEVIVSTDELTTPASDGLQKLTLRGMQSLFAMTQINLPSGQWAAGVQFTAVNQYMAFGGVGYKVKDGVTLPYTTLGSDPTSGPDVGNVEPFNDITSDQVDDRIGELSNYEFKSVDDMIAGTIGSTTIVHAVNAQYSSGGTSWRVVSIPVVDISNFEALSPVCAADFGDINVITNIIGAYNNRNGNPLILGDSTVSEVGIPSNFPNLPDAFEFIKVITDSQHREWVINIEAGHALTHGLVVSSYNASHITIKSDDAVVFLDPSFIPGVISPEITGVITNDVIFGSEFGATSFVLDCLIDAQEAAGTGTGFMVVKNSEGLVNGGAGVINADGYGLLVNRASKIDAASTRWEGSNYGVRVTTSSFANIAQANLDGCRSATYAGSGTTAGLDVSRGSVVNFKGLGGTVRNCAARGIASRRSRVAAGDVDASNAGTDCVRAENNSDISFENGIADNAGNDAITSNGSNITAPNALCTNATRYGVISENGSIVSCREVDVAGYGSRGLFSLYGSMISARQATAQQDGVSDLSTDISVQSGGNISASSATGGTNQAINTITANGIIYK